MFCVWGYYIISQCLFVFNISAVPQAHSCCRASLGFCWYKTGASS
jgi:hypothetical protein